MNTDTISTGIIAVDYSKPLQNMMADGSYDWVNPAITPKGFPITAVGIVQFETKVFHFNRYISSEDAVEAITADDRRNFWEPAKIEGLLAYGVKNPNEQRQYPIVGLGSFAGVLGSRYVPYLYGAAPGAVSTFFGGTSSGTVTTVSWPFASCPRSTQASDYRTWTLGNCGPSPRRTPLHAPVLLYLYIRIRDALINFDVLMTEGFGLEVDGRMKAVFPTQEEVQKSAENLKAR